MAVKVATFEQIANILTQLSTNYSGIVNSYYNIFFNPTPMDVPLQMYNDEGTLVEVLVPNRAKDKSYIYNGSGSPEGMQVASVGSVYQDLVGGSLYIKQFGNDSFGWTKFVNLDKLEEILKQGNGSPESVVAAGKGVLYIDVVNSGLYIKTTSTGNSGWMLISTNTDLLANTDLSNLTSVGLTQFADPDLSNLSSAGMIKFNEKEDASNKINKISEDTQSSAYYPTTKAVYEFVEEEVNKRATRALDNLEDEGKWDHFINYNQVRDCIKYAPNGLPTIADASGQSFIIPEGTVFLGAAGVDPNECKVNRVSDPLPATITFSLVEDGEYITDPDTDYVVLYDLDSSTIRYTKASTFYIQKDAPETFEGIWFCNDYVDNTKGNMYYYATTEEGVSSWVPHVMTEILRFSTDTNKAPKPDFIQYPPLTVLTDADLYEKLQWGYLRGDIKNQRDLINEFNKKLTVNADNLSNEGKKVFDGAWVSSNIDLDAPNTDLGEYEIDLSSCVALHDV